MANQPAAQATTDDIASRGDVIDRCAPAETADRPMSALVAGVLAPFRPQLVGRKTTKTPFLNIWCVHLLACLLGVALVLIISATGDAIQRGNVTVGDELMRAVGSITREVTEYPIQATLAVMGIFLLVQTAHVALAFLFMPWGAKDEPIRASFRQAARQTYLATGRILVAIAIISSTAIFLISEQQNWIASNRTRPNPWGIQRQRPASPTLAEDDPGYAAAKQKFDKELEAYSAEFNAAWDDYHRWRQEQPWYIRDPEFLFIPFAFLIGLWFLWALLRGIGAPRRVGRIERDKRCIDCGYDLHTIPIDSRCPECGTPVIDSLGPRANAGAPWLMRSQMGAWTTFCETARGILLRPAEFGKSLRVGESSTDHRRFLGASLAVIWLIGATMILTGAAIFVPPSEFTSQPGPLIAFPIMLGTGCVAGALALTCGAACVIGLHHSLRHKRNLLPGAMQAVSYLGPFLAIWAFLGGVLGLTLAWCTEAKLMRALADRIGMFEETMTVLAFCVPNFCLLLFYLNRVARATGATRYANK